MSFVKHYHDYLNVLVSLNYSKTTIQFYRRVLKELWIRLVKRHIALDEMSASFLDEYKESLLKKDSRNYVYSRLLAIRKFYKYLYREGIIESFPFHNYSFIRPEKHLPKDILTEEEMKAILALSSESTFPLRDQAICELYYATGLRLSELINLNIDQIHASENLVFVNQGKGRKDRKVPVTDFGLRAVKKYIACERFLYLKDLKETALFISVTGKRIGRSLVFNLFKRMREASGLSKKVHPHMFRHCFATHLLKEGANVRHIQEMLGHEDISTTQRYTKVELSDLKRVIRLYHPLENELYTSSLPESPSSKLFERRQGCKRKKRKAI